MSRSSLLPNPFVLPPSAPLVLASAVPLTQHTSASGRPLHLSLQPGMLPLQVSTDFRSFLSSVCSQALAEVFPPNLWEAAPPSPLSKPLTLLGFFPLIYIFTWLTAYSNLPQDISTYFLSFFLSFFFFFFDGHACDIWNSQARGRMRAAAAGIQDLNHTWTTACCDAASLTH